VSDIIGQEIPGVRPLVALSLESRGGQPRVDLTMLEFDEAAVLTAPLPPVR
jgi:hypothetical protein